MKNKNQSNNIFSWRKISNDKLWILYVSIIFVVGVIFSWGAILNLLGNSFISNLYLLAEDDDTVSMGANAAMTNIAYEDNKIYRLLDGVEAEAGLENKIPYAVMIENLAVVRPQSGLQSASLVYEALVEGGATRFMAIFDPSQKVDEIMPVRSARQYYLEWSSEYDAVYAHAGGSPTALAIIRDNEDIIELEALGRAAKYFWRDTTKYAPHNLVTSSEKINFALRDLDLNNIKTDYTPWKFKDEVVLESRQEAKQLRFNYSYGLTYEVKYDYNIEKNIYYRVNANQPHLDKNTGQQISVKNVIVQIVPEPVLDGGKGRLDINVGGSGKAWILLNGSIIEGTWTKESRTDRTLFYDSEGQEMEFNRGNTWIHILPKTQAVFYE